MGMFLSDTAFGTVEAKMGKKGSSLKWLRTSKSDLEHTAETQLIKYIDDIVMTGTMMMVKFSSSTISIFVMRNGGQNLSQSKQISIFSSLCMR